MMRNNLPVTTIETIVPQGVFIYSRTDLKGVITEANPAFAQISGYQVEEMIGQPHNLIRHPDMPPEAFADLWRSLKVGRPWKGVVKNRRKDGGFYWVEANVSPVRENGQVIGYQSVRLCPSREQIAAAEAAYQRVKRGDRSLCIRGGRVCKSRPAWVEKVQGCEFRLLGFGVLSLILATLTLAMLMWPGNTLLNGVLGAVAVLTWLFGAWTMICGLPRNLALLQATHAALEEALTKGHLAANLSVRDEDAIGKIALSVETLLASTRATLQIITDATREVADSSGALNESMHALVDASSKQGELTAAVATGAEQMSSSIAEVVDHAASTHAVALVVGEKATQGVVQAARASESICQLSSTVSRSAETVEQLGLRTQDVAKVAGAIKEIADQTNLLALNAAIEAARAGEEGRGFAVVADEVRKLAERTARATQEIDRMIAHIHADTNLAVEGMRQSAEQVTQSVTQVKEAESLLLAINTQMDDTVARVSEILHSAKEQNTAMDNVAHNVEHVAHLADDNVLVARSTGNAADALAATVAKMRKAVAQYRT